MIVASDMQILDMLGLDVKPLGDFTEPNLVLGWNPSIAGKVQQELVALHPAYRSPDAVATPKN